MQFIDEAQISVEAGHGGAGHKSFRREAFVPLGGPDGGDGGRGGSVYIVADSSVHTLLDFRFRPKWKAEDGERGDGSNRTGKSGQDITIHAPLGTQVFREDRSLVADLIAEGEPVQLAKGGRGGRGNAFFKSPTNRVPEKTQPGERGESGVFQLSLKLVADVGLVGFPNAGKSTLISRISAARPKIADYPFTTLVPHLGVARAKSGRSFVVADIPGLIPGASSGKGLGTTFLKHIERTRFILHLIDLHTMDEKGEPIAPMKAYEIIQHELESFSSDLAAKPQMIVFTKIDLHPDRSEITRAQEACSARGLQNVAISAATGEGIDALLEHLATELAAHQ